MKTAIWGLLGTWVLTSAAHAVPIVIQVSGPDGKPAANAEVRALRPQDNLPASSVPRKPLYETGHTDEKGVARFDWPEPKVRRNLVMGGRDKYMGKATIWTPTTGATNVTLKPGDNDVKLKAAGFARGTVLDAVGAPVAGAKVRAVSAYGMADDSNFVDAGDFSLSEDDDTFATTTDAQGRWQIGNLPVGGRARVQLEGENYAVDSAFAPIIADLATTPPTITAPPSALNQNGKLRAAPPATLTGRVLTPEGKPVAGIGVWARPLSKQDQGYFAPQRAETDAKGEYTLQRLPEGNYKIGLYVPHTNSLVADPSAAPTVKLASGETQSVADQKLIVGGTITVQVRDANTGKPILGAAAIAMPAGNLVGEILTDEASDEKGDIHMNVAPGNYRVQVWQQPAGYVRPAPFAEVTKVAAGAQQNLVVKLKTGALATGRLVDEKGKAVPKIQFLMRAEKRQAVGQRLDYQR